MKKIKEACENQKYSKSKLEYQAQHYSGAEKTSLMKVYIKF